MTNSDLIVQAVKDGQISLGRIDEAAIRILTQKFEQGLFENPYVDPDKAAETVGNREFVNKATAAQSRATVLLENHNETLPLKKKGLKLYLYQVDSSAATSRGYKVVAKPAEADIAIIRMNAPYQQPHANYFFGARQQEGDLDFKPGNAELDAFNATASVVPTVATIYLSRPAVIPTLKQKAAALLGNFGLSDEALFDVLEGRQSPAGKLPFELPSSMDDVLRQASDVPHDTPHPLYPIGYGMLYQNQ